MEYTDEQIRDMLQRESDRRVTEALKKAEAKFSEQLNSAKTDWERENLEKAKLTAEELAKKELEQKMSEVSKREAEISKRTNHINALELLAEAKISKEHYTDMLELMVSDNADVTTTNVNRFITMFNKTKNDLETTIRTEMTKVPPPKTGSGSTELTKQAFDKMGYAQKLELKNTNPDLYKSFIN